MPTSARKSKSARVSKAKSQTPRLASKKDVTPIHLTPKKSKITPKVIQKTQREPAALNELEMTFGSEDKHVKKLLKSPMAPIKVPFSARKDNRVV